MTQHRHEWTTGSAVLVGGEASPERGCETERRQVAGIGDLVREPLRFSAGPDRRLVVRPETEGLEDGLCFAEGRELRVRPYHVIAHRTGVAMRNDEAHLHQALGLTEGKRAQEHRIDRAEDRRIRPDTDSESQDRDDGEGHRAAEGAQREADVLAEHVDETQTGHATDLFLVVGYVAESTTCSEARVA